MFWQIMAYGLGPILGIVLFHKTCPSVSYALSDVVIVAVCSTLNCYLIARSYIKPFERKNLLLEKGWISLSRKPRWAAWAQPADMIEHEKVIIGLPNEPSIKDGIWSIPAIEGSFDQVNFFEIKFENSTLIVDKKIYERFTSEGQWELRTQLEKWANGTSRLLVEK
ncbi:TPA: hypothetical protein DD449_03880 [Candidatus Berkelbacteria bacterium]|uniref:Uncharacterized protein n=1 Tax=Berkelbacteria bacterium GW2011_GWE1_39_12 TaxID=1618337 RepID=A0A0G4B4A5_9BACT|nr:MAG: hypothetical protein UT28_C0001G0412 [Berkelbacteria bacterium GW2011_GWE1_39_12]HBO60796.1 hypothetical protein [Candidatus Berkelbacteria bacterium]